MVFKDLDRCAVNIGRVFPKIGKNPVEWGKRG